MKKLIKILSISDVITNSSTEVFMMKNDEEFKEISKELKCVYLQLLSNEEDVKKYIKELYEYGGYEAFEWFSEEVVKTNPLSNYIFYDICREIPNNTFDNVWNFVKEFYLPLIGYVLIEQEDNTSPSYDDELYKELCFLQSLCEEGKGFMDRH